MRSLKLTHIGLFLALALLTACAQLGVTSPQTFQDRLVIGYSTITEVTTAANTLLLADSLRASDGQNIANQASVLKAGLDVAREIAKTDPTQAENRLTAIRTALVGLQTYLASREGEQK